MKTTIAHRTDDHLYLLPLLSPQLVRSSHGLIQHHAQRNARQNQLDHLKLNHLRHRPFVRRSWDSISCFLSHKYKDLCDTQNTANNALLRCV